MKSNIKGAIFCNPDGYNYTKGSFHDLNEFRDAPSPSSWASSDVDFQKRENDEQGFETVLEHEALSVIESDDYDDQVVINPVANENDKFRYRIEKFERALNDDSCRLGTNRRDAVFGALERMGIKTFIIVAGPADTNANHLTHVRQVVTFVTKLNRNHEFFAYKRCLLFQDTEGRIFNLLTPMIGEGLVSKWHSNMDRFSGLQAIVVLTVLTRSFPCMKEGSIGALQPTFIGVILGLIFTEEFKYSSLNACMLVRGCPSISASTLNSFTNKDWLFQILMVLFLLAGFQSENLRTVSTCAGISLATLMILANLGSRAWFFLKWRPFCYDGYFAGFFAYIAAVCTGIIFPWMSYREIEARGKAAIESMLKSSIFVVIIFIITDYDPIQKVLIVGSESCDQSLLNIVVGSWIGGTLLFNMFWVLRKDQEARWEQNEDVLLVEDHTSPVGYKVPNLPNFYIDPRSSAEGAKPFTLECEMYTTVLVALFILVVVVSTAFSDWDEFIADNVESLLSRLFE